MTVGGVQYTDVRVYARDVFTIVGSFQDGIADDFQTSGRGTGTLFLWLLPLVIGWQRLSPRSDYIRVRDALHRANTEVYTASQIGFTPTLRSTASSLTSLFSSPRASFKGSHPSSRTRQPGSVLPIVVRKAINQKFPFRLKQCEGDQGASAPIYSYSRLIPWSENVELVAGAFRAAAHIAAANDFDAFGDHDARRQSLAKVDDLIRCSVRPVDWRAVLRRCIMAGVLAMILHWGAIGSAIVYSFNTPTTGLGCRSGSFLIYASLGTLVWIIMVVSSFLTYYAQEAERDKERRESPREPAPPRRRLSPQTLHWLATMLRHIAKLLATFNAIFIVAMCIFLFSNLFTNCWCDASLISRGLGAFTTIALQPDDESLGQLNVAWGIAIAMSLGSATIFIAFVYMHVNPADPDPFFLQDADAAAESFAGSPGPDLFVERQHTIEVELPTRGRDSDAYDTDSMSVGTSPDVGHSAYSRSPHVRKGSSFSI
ncbi:hypothetical protein PENSPDRAFT_755262 [Peniophora sp. CONT]|nr:hypothetical protein PENSPDRAFT_755262 [Peniophora sp. CONT]